MKFFKLSLAAAVAAGSLASVASAMPLEEAIKNVDVSGYARYRVDANSVKAGEDKTSSAGHRFTSDITLKSTFDDYFFGVVGFRYDTASDKIYGAGDADKLLFIGQSDEGKGKDGYGQTLNVREGYFGFNAAGTTVQLGRQELGTFFTDDMVGDGIKITNSSVPGLTLAALAMSNLEKDEDIGTLDLPLPKQVTQHPLYGVAAIGSYDPVSFQLWYANLQDVTNLFAADAAVNFNLSDSVSFGLQGQFGYSAPVSKFKDLVGVADKGYFFALKPSVNFNYGDNALEFTGGYINFGTGKDKTSLVSFEDQGKFISPGEKLLSDSIVYNRFDGKNQFGFVTGKYTFADKVSVGADFVFGENKTETHKIKASEVVLRLGYKHSKKLAFNTYWSHLDTKQTTFQQNGDESSKGKQDSFRFEVKYSF